MELTASLKSYLLDTAAVVGFTQSLTWNGKSAVVTLVTKTYHTGVKLTKQAMQSLETQIERLPGLEKWFVHIPACLNGFGILNSS